MSEPGANVASRPGRPAIGCIGSRDLPPDEAAACRRIAADLARGGFAVITGATPGEPGRDTWAEWADGAFAYGAARAAPDALIACLPWRHFPRGGGTPEPDVAVWYADEHPEWREAAAAYWAATHDADEGDWAEAVPRAARLRHERNVGIVLNARMLLAWPRGEAEGTRFAMGFAAWRGVPVHDLTQTQWWTVAGGLTRLLTERGLQQQDR
jgi:hypothetical protein